MNLNEIFRILKKHFFQGWHYLFNRIYIRVFFTYLVFLALFMILLSLPGIWVEPKKHGWQWLDSFYLATSAFTNTGLHVRHIGREMTLWGQFIIFLLMIMGGLGLLFFKIFFIQTLRWIFRLNISTKVFQEQRFERGGDLEIKKIRRMLKVSFGFLLLIQLVGFILLFCVFYFDSPPILKNQMGNERLGKSLWYGLFHSVSATNNAGFDVIPVGHSLSVFSDSWAMQTIFIIQFVLGGLGFFVFLDFWDWIKSKFHKLPFQFSFFTRFSLFSYSFIAIIGISLIFLSEGLDKSHLSVTETGGEFASRVIFNTLSCRSAGYSTVDIGNSFTDLSQLIMIILMWIGTSPLSTGGGVKTIVFMILIHSLYAPRDEKNNIIITRIHRSFEQNTVYASMASSFLSIVLIFGGVFLSMLLKNFTTPNSIFNERNSLVANLFYFTSAIGNVGLSTISVTDQPLWVTFKLYTIFLMIIGQIGVGALFSYRQRSLQRNYTAFPLQTPI